MEYYRYGRSLVPAGGVFDDAESALEFCNDVEQEVLLEQIQNLSFTLDDEGLLLVLLNNKRHFISHSALKDLCKLLKVPASYINKFPGRHLVLENLNNNPYLIDNSDPIKLVLWKGEEFPVITGVLPGNDPAMPFNEYLSLLIDEDVFEREETSLEQIAVTGEEMVLYFQLPQEITREGFHFKGGYAIHYSATRAVDAEIHPFLNMTIVAPTGEPFDFDYESPRKQHIVKRRKEDFLNKFLELSQFYKGEDLGSSYEEAIKFGTVARSMDSVKYSLLKFFKSKAMSIYNYSGVKVEGNAVAEEIIPEYNEFFFENKENLKEMETYAANNLQVHFYLPVYFNRIFTFQPSIENPYFLIRYRKAIGVALTRVLDEIGDLMVESEPQGEEQE
ncbi:MAG: hypothetical protein D6748_15125 [Calditrichaeota bacterium]|nr:MAG: hypothetical protein D6748_15125 [Calditrichota bacterium]